MVGGEAEWVEGVFEHPDPVGLKRVEALREVRLQLGFGHWREGLRRLERVDREWRWEKVVDEEKAREAVRKYLFDGLLEREKYLEASALMWSGGMFEQRPAHITRIFRALGRYDLNILLGASGLSKTYSAAAYHAMDFIRDPENTGVKIGSVNDTNLKGNLWANMKVFVNSALFKPNVILNEARMRMSVSKTRPECGIDAVLFSKAADSTGKIKGFHPKPFRETPHAKYGDLTVMRIMLDETQELPAGVESDLGSPKSTMDETGAIKITMTCNPVHETKWVVKLASPEGGWEEKSQLDSLYDYDAPSGWHVTRLDAARFENVVFRRTVFPGFTTRQAYEAGIVNGVPGANHYVFARGFPPPSRASDTVVPSSWFELAKGEPMYTGLVVPIGGGDIAFVNDQALLAVGRYGLATGWVDKDGSEQRFPSRVHPGEFESRHVGVLDDLIVMESVDNAGLVAEIIDWCGRLGIDPESLCVDKTGNGFGTWSDLCKRWGSVVGVHWKESPTETKIVAEDKGGADEQCSSKVSEMYWTVHRWMDPRVRALFVNPNCKRQDVLKTQLTNRRWKFVRTVVDVESKDEYLKRLKTSPDEADAFVQMCNVPRWRGLALPALVDEAVGSASREKKKNGVQSKVSDVSITLPRAGWVRPSLSAGSRYGGEWEAPGSMRR